MMRRLFLPLLAGCLLFASCASTPPAGDGAGDSGNSSSQGNQEEVNQAFEKVYHDYGQLLIMEGADKYQVQYGDTLSSIAKDFYGKDNGYYFPLIMLASSQTVLDPDLIEPGMSLTVPDLQRNLQDSAVRDGLRPFFTEISDVYRNKQNSTAERTRQELLKIAEGL